MCVYGDTAIAEGTTEIAGAKPGDEDQDRFTDAFKKRNGRWLAINEQETRVAAVPSSPRH